MHVLTYVQGEPSNFIFFTKFPYDNSLTKYEGTMVTYTAGVTLVLPYMVIVMLCAFADISIYVQNTAHATV